MLLLRARSPVSDNLHLPNNLANSEEANDLGEHNAGANYLSGRGVADAVQVAGDRVDQALGVVARVVGVAHGGDEGIVGFLELGDGAARVGVLVS